jgi:hypothetical protein
VPRAEQLQERGLGVGARRHRCGRDAFAGLEFHSHRPIRFDQNSRHRRSGADFGARLGRRLRQSIAQCAQAAGGLRQSSRTARELGSQTVQQGQHRSRRTRTEIRAEHGVEPQRAFENIGLEVLLEQIEDVHPADPQQLAHVAPTEPADLPTQAEQCPTIGPIGSAQSRGHLTEERRQRLGEAPHARAIHRIGRDIRTRQTGWIHGQRRATGKQGRGRHALRGPFEAMGFQLEFTDQFGGHEMQQMRAARHLKSRREFSCRGCSADARLRLQYEHRTPAARQGGGADQAVMTAADYDAIIARWRASRRHVSAPSLDL